MLHKRYLFYNVKRAKNFKAHNFRKTSNKKYARWKAREIKIRIKLMAALA